MGTLNKRSIIFNGAGTAYAHAVLDATYLDFIQTDLFSLGGWWRTPAQTIVAQVLMGKQSSLTTPGYRKWYENGRFHFLLRDSSSNEIEIAVGALGEFAIGAMPHVVAVKGAGTTDAALAIYVEGVLQDDTGGTTREVITPGTLTASISSGEHFEISGIANTLDNMLNGEMAFAAVWGIALTGADVTALFNGGDPANPLDVVSTEPLGFFPADFSHFDRASATDRHIVNVIANGAAQSTTSLVDLSRNHAQATGSGINIPGDFPADSPGGISTRSLEGVGGNERFVVDDGTLNSFDGNDPLSISLRVKRKSSPSAAVALFTKFSGTPGAGQGLALEINLTGGTVAFFLNDDNADRTVIAGSTDLTDDTWHHLMITKGPSLDGSDWTMRLDDADELPTIVLANLFTGAGTTWAVANGLQVSGRDGNNATLTNNDHLSEVRLWPRVLTPAEQTAEYNGGPPTYPVGLFDPVLGPVYWARPGEDMHHLDMVNMFDEDVLVGGVPTVGAVADTTAPTVTLISPLSGVLGLNTQVVLLIEDELGGDNIRRASVWHTPQGGKTEVVYDGTTFLVGFSGSRLDTANGFELTINRVGGFFPPLDFRVSAHDKAGNEASS